METIEKKVADTILQGDISILEIENVKYHVGHPTIGTLILVSELVANYPAISDAPESMLIEVLRTARNSKLIGDVAAALILGAKRIKEHRTVYMKKYVPCCRFSYRKMRKVEVYKEVLEPIEEKDALAQMILLNCRSSIIRDIIQKRFNELEIADFFGITTSLCEANILAATKEVVTATEMIASGQ